MAFNVPSGFKKCHLSPLLAALKALFHSVSIDRGGVGVFLGCFVVASITDLSFFVTESQRRRAAMMRVVDRTLGSSLRGKGERLKNMREPIYIQWFYLTTCKIAGFSGFK